jgi:hypothetical protein
VASLLVSSLRVQSDPDDVPAVRDVGPGQLPEFPARDRTGLHLWVAIPLRDPRQELVQPKSGARESKAQLTLLERDLDLCGWPQPRAFGKWLRNSDRQAVPPFLDSGSHRVGIYIKYTESGAVFEHHE